MIGVMMRRLGRARGVDRRARAAFGRGSVNPAKYIGFQSLGQCIVTFGKPAVEYKSART
jgi:hypothetical protein